MRIRWRVKNKKKERKKERKLENHFASSGQKAALNDYCYFIHKDGQVDALLNVSPSPIPKNFSMRSSLHILGSSYIRNSLKSNFFKEHISKSRIRLESSFDKVLHPIKHDSFSIDTIFCTQTTSYTLCNKYHQLQNRARSFISQLFRLLCPSILHILVFQLHWLTDPIYYTQQLILGYSLFRSCA